MYTCELHVQFNVVSLSWNNELINANANYFFLFLEAHREENLGLEYVEFFLENIAVIKCFTHLFNIKKQLSMSLSYIFLQAIILCDVFYISEKAI